MDDLFEWLKEANRKYNLLKKAVAGIMGTAVAVGALIALALIIIYPQIIIVAILFGVIYLISNAIYEKLF